MDSTTGALAAGGMLLMTALRRLEDNAVDEVRREVMGKTHRSLRRTRRRARDVAAFLRLVTGLILLVQFLRAVLREDAPNSPGQVQRGIVGSPAAGSSPPRRAASTA